MKGQVHPSVDSKPAAVTGSCLKGVFSLAALLSTLVFLFASRLAIRVYIVIGNSETNFPSTNTTRAERGHKEFSSVQFFSSRLFVTRSRTIPPPLLCGMDVFMLIEREKDDGRGGWLQTGQIRFQQERNLVSFKDGERKKKLNPVSTESQRPLKVYIRRANNNRDKKKHPIRNTIKLFGSCGNAHRERDRTTSRMEKKREKERD